MKKQYRDKSPILGAVLGFALFGALSGVASAADTERASYPSVETSEAEAFRGQPVRNDQDVSFGVGANHYDAFGLNVRFAQRLLKQPIPDVNNSLLLEGNVGASFYGTVAGTNGVAGFHGAANGRWDFQLDHQWKFFGLLGLGYNAVTADRRNEVRGGGFFPVIGVGSVFQFERDWGVRVDLGYHFAGVGLTKYL